MNYENPLIVQGDRSLLLDVHAPLAEECRNALIPFAELEKSPEHLHTYRLTPLSLWNAASAGFSADDAAEVLQKYARYDVPQSVVAWIKETESRFGKITLIAGPDIEVPVKEGSAEKIVEHFLYLVADSLPVFKEIGANHSVKKLLTTTTCHPELDSGSDAPQYSFLLKLTDRGTIKQLLLQAGWPVKDEVALIDGEPLDVSLRETTSSGRPLEIREYQKGAAHALVGDRGPGTGFGTIVLPCGAGKTIVGMTIMDMLKTSTLIITTNISAVHQWIDELLDKTNLTADQIAEYSGESKTIKQVTVATYQVLTWRPDKEGPYPHFSIFHERPWGLIIYDEVHMLPAPVFRVVADLQAVRRVGLTATLVREDGCEGYVFSLVGPKRYDVPWKELERDRWIASAECIEVRIDLPGAQEIDYAVAGTREKHKIASMNPDKLPVVRQIIDHFPDDKILVIGQYLQQLDEIVKELGCPIITGKTPNTERDRIYNDFREGKIRVLVVSKVANFAIDLPDASLAIQVSGTFGSRQEEAQRLGRILRPKERKSRFFTLITRNTVEEEFGSNRQKFLAEQGYEYKIVRYDGELNLDE
ncbi:DNA excision repair protein ERCC-3 [Treponema bryantii]|uniref:DNA 3'-5' helicase n=1 Tax=Treponema bryantii TaxID=163 RepID=A0A1I3IC93_9SPIR|nr:DNA repair helicase XPB [Treponema bryantii]SFI45561.1 DNA excision repair protein ERCC-3 [Treponema bryantii]